MADTTIGTSVAIATPDLEIIEGQITTSRQVAAHFNERHDNVMRAIRNIGAEADADFYRRNFEEVITEFTNGKGGTQQAPADSITGPSCVSCPRWSMSMCGYRVSWPRDAGRPGGIEKVWSMLMLETARHCTRRINPP